MRIIVAVFMVLHGLVHLLYFGQGRKFFELQPGLVWPEGSWAFSKLLSNEAVSLLASISCVLAAIGFVAGGVGILARQTWWQATIVVVAAFSAGIFVLFWDRNMQRLPDKGAIGLLINAAILVSLLVWQWPNFEF